MSLALKVETTLDERSANATEDRAERVFADGGKCSGQVVRCRQRSVVAGRFLGELHPRRKTEFGVDVGEVGLHGAS